MRFECFGTRGSLPVPGAGTVRYGGNTSCFALTSDAGTLVVLDMGTGIRALGQRLMATPGPVRGHVLVSHTHWDHIQGLPFFAPLFRPGDEWHVHAPRGLSGSLRQTLAGQMQHTYFPLELDQLGATIRFHELVEGRFDIDDVAVRTQYLNHPALTLGYRLTVDGATVVYALDHEPFAAAAASGEGPVEGPDARHLAFVAGADLLVHDAQYLHAEYAARRGWGHSTVEYVLRLARDGGVGRVLLAHHDPARDDAAVDGIVARFADAARAHGVALEAAAEGRTVELRGTAATPEAAAAVPTALTAPAVVDRHAVVAGAAGARLALLSEALRLEGVGVTVCDLAGLAATVEAVRPSLVLIADPGDEGTLARAVAGSRPEGGGAGAPVVVLVGPDDGPTGTGADFDAGVDGRLVEPVGVGYARARIRAWLLRRACNWERAPRPADEERRLDAIRAFGLLDAPPDPELDRMVTLARDLFRVPIAAVTLIDADRQWMAAECGFDTRETPRDEAFCAHVVANPRPLQVPDTLLDHRFADNPLVTGAPHLRFYAGHPILLDDGRCLGSFCIADVRPRAIDDDAADHLASLARIAAGILGRALERNGRRG